MPPKKAIVGDPTETRKSARTKTKPTRLIEQAPTPVKSAKPKSILKIDGSKAKPGEAKRGRPNKKAVGKAKKVTIQEPDEEESEEEHDADEEEEEEDDEEEQDEEVEDEEDEVEEPEPEPAPTKKQNIGKKRAPPAKQAGPAPKKQKITQSKPSGKASQIKGKPVKGKQPAKRATAEVQDGVAAGPAKKKAKTAASKEATGGAKGKKTKATATTAATPAESARSSSVPLLPDYFPGGIDRVQDDGVTYNSTPSSEIPNITIPLGSRFRIEMGVVGLANDGTYSCDCAAFKKSSKTIKTCKHLFLLNGHRFEESRLSHGGAKGAVASSSKQSKVTTASTDAPQKETTGGVEPDGVGESNSSYSTAETSSLEKQGEQGESLEKGKDALSGTLKGPESSDSTHTEEPSEEASSSDARGSNEAEKAADN